MARLRMVALLAAVLVPAVSPGSPAAAAPPPGSSCPLFPKNNVWHSDVRSLPKHPRSDAWIRAMGGPNQLLHPDFGPSDDPAEPYGIPFNVEGPAHAKVSVSFQYTEESDPGPYPVDDSSWVENGSDRHVLVLQDCRLYELFDFDWNGGNPTAGSGAIWDLRS
ncbi:MAG TPA: hypothetical protein VG602_01665, partial [Actinomycetota bacterium]|nr:hypothetical protein [Actinomycetota bacterium]